MTFTLVNKVEVRAGHSFDSFSVEGGFDSFSVKEVLYGLGHCPSRGVSHEHRRRVLCGREESFIFDECTQFRRFLWDGTLFSYLVLAAVCQVFPPGWLVLLLAGKRKPCLRNCLRVNGLRLGLWDISPPFCLNLIDHL